MTPTVTIPRWLTTRALLAEVVPMSRAKWSTYYRQHRALRDARRVLDGKHVWDARAVARHMEGLPR